MELTIKGKSRVSEKLFVAILVLFVVPLIIRTTLFTRSYLFESILFAIGILLSFVKIFVVDKASIKFKLCAVLFVLFGFLSYSLFTNSLSILITILLVLSAVNMNESFILKVYFVVSAFFLVLMTVASLIGIIPDWVFVLRDGISKHSFGSVYPTDYVSRVMFMCLIGLYLYAEKLKVIHVSVIVFLAGVLFYFTGAKINVVCILLTVLLFYFGKKCSVFKFVSEKLMVFLMPLFAVMITLLSVLYSPSNSFWNALNLFMNDRLLYGHQAFSDIGVSLFGKDVLWVGVSGAISGAEYNFVDASYLNCLFSFGVIGLISFVAAFTLICMKKRGHIGFMFVILIISLNAVFEHHLFDVAYNPFLLLLFSNLDVEDKFCVMSKK